LSSSPAKPNRWPSRRNGANEVVQAADYIENHRSRLQGLEAAPFTTPPASPLWSIASRSIATTSTSTLSPGGTRRPSSALGPKEPYGRRLLTASACAPRSATASLQGILKCDSSVTSSPVMAPEPVAVFVPDAAVEAPWTRPRRWRRTRTRATHEGNQTGAAESSGGGGSGGCAISGRLAGGSSGNMAAAPGWPRPAPGACRAFA
jgi:hypothetical protein